MVRAPRGLIRPGFRLPWPAGGQVGWPSRWDHFSGPGGRTAARVPFPRVRSRPLCREVAKSGPHDAGGYPGRNFARASGPVGPKQRKETVEGYPSRYRSVDQENRLLGEMKYGHSLVLWAASGGRNRLPAPKGPRWTPVRLREQKDGPVATSRGSPRLAAYREGRGMSSCRPNRGR